MAVGYSEGGDVTPSSSVQLCPFTRAVYVLNLDVMQNCAAALTCENKQPYYWDAANPNHERTARTTSASSQVKGRNTKQDSAASKRTACAAA